MCFCVETEEVGDLLAATVPLSCDVDGSFTFSSNDAGGPTGTIRLPNSTPIVTSWCGEKRPSHSRMVS